MPYETPSVEQFRARFPEFDVDAYPDSIVQAVLDEAVGGVGLDWIERDYQPGILYLTAHQLTLWQQSSATFAGSDGSGPVNSIEIEGRTVGFDTNKQLAWVNQWDVELGSTFYGQQYLRLTRRNAPRVLTTYGP